VKRTLAMAITLAIVSSGCAADRTGPTSLVGVWRSSVQFQSGAFAPIHDLEFMYAFHGDGTLTESSNYDAAPPVPPAYGVWRAIGAREFEARYDFFSTAASAPDAFAKGAGWNPSGRGILTERIQLSSDGNAFTSTLRYEPLDAQGKPAQGGGTATGRGTRMHFEARAGTP